MAAREDRYKDIDQNIAANLRTNHQRSSSGRQFAALIANVCPTVVTCVC